MSGESIKAATVPLPPGVHATPRTDSPRDRSAPSPPAAPHERLASHRRLRRAMAARSETLVRLAELIQADPDRPRIASERPQGDTGVAELRAENERLRAADAAHVQERARLIALVRDLRRELEENGRELRGQTAALRSVGAAAVRSGPHQMIRQRRSEEREGGGSQRMERLEGSVKSLRERECGLSSSLRRMEDRHRVTRHAWAAQEQELKRYAGILEAYVTRMERQLPPEPLCSAKLFNIALRVLSCEGLFNRQNNGAGFIDPFVVLYGPCGERLLETLPCEDTDCPSFATGENTVTVKAVRDSPWDVIVEVYSRGANDARLFLGRATLPLGPLLAELTETVSSAEQVRTLPLFPRERELDPEIESHADVLGNVALSVAVFAVGTGIKRCAAARTAPVRDTVRSRAVANASDYTSEMRFVRVAGGRGVLKRNAQVKSHPYVIARRGAVELLRTAPASATTNPFWDCEAFPVRDLWGPPIVFDVYDHSGDGNIDDDFLGEAQLTGEDLMSGDEWFELVLRPRRDEPLSYIREYQDRLGKILVQCTIEKHSGGRRSAKWTRRQSSSSSTVVNRNSRRQQVAAVDKVEAPQTAIEPSAKLAKHKEVTQTTREKVKLNTQVGSHTNSDSAHSQYQPGSLSETQHPSPEILPLPVYQSTPLSSRKAPSKVVEPVVGARAVAPEAAQPLSVEGILSSSNGEEENDAYRNASGPLNRSSLDPIRLCIYVKEGKDLLDCDQAMFEVLGVTDPRVLVWVGPDCVFTVNEKRDTVNPQWSKEEGQFFANVQMNHIIRFEVQDVDITGFDSLGTATVHVSDILERLGERSLPVVLHGKQYGTLTVIFELES